MVMGALVSMSTNDLESATGLAKPGTHPRHGEPQGSRFRLGLRLAGLVLAGWTAVSVGRLGLHAYWHGIEYEPPPPGMVLVPAGEFMMGSNEPDADPDERPLRRVFLRAFYIDRLEVSNRRYREFNPEHRYPAGQDDLPVTFVFKRDAEAFCRWAGRRLPTSAEWEKAARGTDGRTYPWGKTFDPALANVERSSANSVSNGLLCRISSSLADARGKLPGGSFPAGASPYGCQDMAGNVWEWVSDVWREETFLRFPAGMESRGILRGGAFSYSPRQARASHQAFEALGATCHDVGFRCAMDAIPRARARPGLAREAAHSQARARGKPE
jgi:formylglycine-generating enzyme required for sulfatase activity